MQLRKFMQFHLSTLFLAMLCVAVVLFFNTYGRKDAPAKIAASSSGGYVIYLQVTNWGWPWAFYTESLLLHINHEGKTIWVNPDGPQWHYNYKNLYFDIGTGVLMAIALAVLNEMRLRRRLRAQSSTVATDALPASPLSS